MTGIHYSIRITLVTCIWATTALAQAIDKPTDACIQTCACLTPQAGLSHVFTEKDITKGVPNSTVLVVGHNLSLKDADFEPVESITEHFAVFTSEQNRVSKLSTEQIKAVLNGQITNWKDLGSPQEGKIKLYLNGGELQKKTLEILLRGLGINRYPQGAVQASNYDDLARKSAADPNAFVIGLRDPFTKGLKMVPVNGVSVLDHADEEYPLVSHTYVYRRKTASKTADELLKSLDLRVNEYRQPKHQPASSTK